MTACILCPGALASPGRHGASEDPADWPPVAAATVRSMQLHRGRITGREKLDGTLDEWPHDHWLHERFALPAEARPEAGDALTLLDAAPPPAALVVRPVHLHVGLDHLTLLPPHAVSLSANAAATLSDAANAHFSAVGGPRFQVLAPGCWLLLAPRPLVVQARSATIAVGRNVADYLPRGEDAGLLGAWINEVQMLWHEHPVNEERESEGHLPVNWLWIEGPVPQPGANPFESVHSDHCAVRGLARAAGTAEVTAAPRGATELGELLDGRRRLIEFSGWRRPVLDADAAGWQDAWSAFGQWLAPALRSMRRQARLEFVLTGEHTTITLEWSPRDRWKWWRSLVDQPPRTAD